MSDEQQVMVNVEYAAMLEQKVKDLQGRLSSESKIVEAYEHAMVALREALGLSGHDEHELVLDEIKRLVGRLDAIREIVEPTGAYLFSGHVNALAEIRAIIVERQETIDPPPYTHYFCPRCGSQPGERCSCTQPSWP